jgi:hypothetical protein
MGLSRVSFAITKLTQVGIDSHLEEYFFLLLGINCRQVPKDIGCQWVKWVGGADCFDHTVFLAISIEFPGESVDCWEKGVRDVFYRWFGENACYHSHAPVRGDILQSDIAEWGVVRDGGEGVENRGVDIQILFEGEVEWGGIDGNSDGVQ